jgi:hypothetical protein
MRPSLYMPGVVLPDLESCFPLNKGLRDKIRLDLNFLRTNRDRRSDHAPLEVRPPAPGYVGLAKIGHQQLYKRSFFDISNMSILDSPL